MSALLLALGLAAAGAAAPVECTTADTFSFEVVRPQKLGKGSVDPSLEGLPFRVTVPGTPVKVEQDVLHGELTLCLHGVKEGMFAVPRAQPLEQRTFQLMYPGADGIPVSQRGQPTLLVCEEKVDCRVDDGQALEALRRLFGQLLQQQRLDTRQLAQQLATMQRSVKDSPVDFGAFARVLELKAAQVKAAQEASRLLATFEDTAQEVADTFRRDAVLAVDWKGKEPFNEMNGAAVAYSGVHDQLRRDADSLRKATAGHWGAARGDAFQALVDEALAVHEHVKELNGVTGLLNACTAKLPACGDRAAARRRVGADVARVGDEIDAGLKAFGVHRRAFQDAQNRELFEAPQDLPTAATP